MKIDFWSTSPTHRKPEAQTPEPAGTQEPEPKEGREPLKPTGKTTTGKPFFNANFTDNHEPEREEEPTKATKAETEETRVLERTARRTRRGTRTPPPAHH